MHGRFRSIIILLADDDEDDCLLIEDALEQSHLEAGLRIVSDGLELLDYLHHRGKYADPGRRPDPDLILLDLNMPRMDGREALRQIKTDPELRRIPVVVLTTSGEEKDIQEVYDLGVNSYITKPVSFDALVDLLDNLGDYWTRLVRLPRTGTAD